MLTLILGVLLGSVGTWLWFSLTATRTKSEKAQRSLFITTPQTEQIGEETKGSKRKQATSKVPSLSELLQNINRSPSAAQVEAFLTRRGRGAEDLVTLFRFTGNESLLREAMENFPSDPMVQLAAVNSTLPLEERLQWAQRLLNSDPNNALAHYIAASIYLKEDPIRALTVLESASGTTTLEDYQDGQMVALAAFFESIGLPQDVAPFVAEQQSHDAYGAPLRQFTHGLRDYAGELRDTNDQQQADRVLASALSMGQRYSQGSQDFQDQLLGITMEAIVVRSLDPNGNYAFLEQTPEAYLESVQEQRKVISGQMLELSLYERWMEAPINESGPIWREFQQRAQLLGQTKALEWFKQQTPP